MLFEKLVMYCDMLNSTKKISEKISSILEKRAF